MPMAQERVVSLDGHRIEQLPQEVEPNPVEANGLPSEKPIPEPISEPPFGAENGGSDEASEDTDIYNILYSPRGTVDDSNQSESLPSPPQITSTTVTAEPSIIPSQTNQKSVVFLGVFPSESNSK